MDFESGAAILIDKPAGITSFKVVERIRRLIRIKKVGHAGTLDPAATGLMIILTGKATKTQDQFMGQGKRYRATVLLGTETDTWDLEGQIVEQRQVPSLDANDLKQLIQTNFFGDILQVPPAFSALKRDGVRSYHRARQGQEVVLEARPVRVDQIELVDLEGPEVTLDLRCSSGFYVRSLAHDLGQKLGCGGTLKQLIRTEIGVYRLVDAFSIDEFAEKVKDARQSGSLR